MKVNIPESNTKRIVIVGGGFGGITIAKLLCRKDYQVVLVDKNNYHTFQPLLYQVATATLEPDSIAYPIREIFKKEKDFYFRMASVEQVISEENKVITDTGDLFYDYLVIATGSDTNYFGMEGLQIHSMPMKNVLEALDLRHLILQNFEKALGIKNERKKKSLMNFVIAGAGPTGVELAGAIGEMKKHIFPKDYPELDIAQMKIYLIQSGGRVLPALSEKSSVKAKKYLEELGVEVVLNTRVVDYFGDYVQTNTGKDFIARTLIWTTGVVAMPIGGLSVESISKSKRIIVDEINKVKGYENIFAIGDVAGMLSSEFPNGHPMVAPVAIQQAKNLSKNLPMIIKGKPTKAFKYFDKGVMATIGKDRAIVEVSNFKLYGVLAWFIWMFVHLMSLVGFRNRVVVFLNWAKNYFTSDRGIRLILRKFDLSKVKRERKGKLEESVN